MKQRGRTIVSVVVLSSFYASAFRVDFEIQASRVSFFFFIFFLFPPFFCLMIAFTCTESRYANACVVCVFVLCR